MSDPQPTVSDSWRPKAKLVTVVWGELYIERLAALSLPSWLAPGNLPTLAAETDLEAVIMTSRSDREKFEQYAAFRRLRSICPVRFVEIDDLITTAVYGVTLTLASARAVISCGADMVKTHFIFMLADFALADGSLRGLSKHIRAGRSIVLGPSFRVAAEAVEPRLLEEVDPAMHTLAITPRDMVALALKHPHPTTLAKTMSQAFCHTVHPNQFFWPVDEHTMLARYFLVFMVCLKPERVVTSVNSYCDYAFIPDMCPSGNEAIMGDSDEFFVLELQRRNQEQFLLRIGRQSETDIARSLSEWTTAEHRRAARYDVVFHARNIPPGIESAKTEARVFVSQLERALGAPVPHAFHPYWVKGVQAWKSRRIEQGLSASPPELAPTWSSRLFAAKTQWRHFLRFPSVWIGDVVLFCYRSILGEAPRVKPLHPDWLDYRLLRETLVAMLSAPGARVLVIREKPEMVDKLVGPKAPVQFASLNKALRGELDEPRDESGGYTHALIYLRRNDCRLTRRLVEHCRLVMNPGGACHVFIHYLGGEMEGGNFSFELVQYFEEIIDPTLSVTSCLIVGGSLKRLNRRLFTRLVGHYSRFGLYSLLWVLPALALTLLSVLVINLLLRKILPTRAFIPYCSSLLMRFDPAVGVPHEQISRTDAMRHTQTKQPVLANVSSAGNSSQ